MAVSSVDVLPYSHGYTYYDPPDEPHCFRQGGPNPKPSPSPNPNLNPNQMRPTGFDEAGGLRLTMSLADMKKKHEREQAANLHADPNPKPKPYP